MIGAGALADCAVCPWPHGRQPLPRQSRRSAARTAGALAVPPRPRRGRREATSASAAISAPSPRPGRESADAAMPKFDDRGLAEVVVPHDWAVGTALAQPADATDQGSCRRGGGARIQGDRPRFPAEQHRLVPHADRDHRGRPRAANLARVRRRFPRLHRLRERLCRRPQRERLRAVPGPDRRFPRL